MSGQGAPPGTPRLLRAHNERAVLEHLRATGPSSRPGLARRAGLSKPTVSQALANLEAAGLVRPVGPASPSMGRTAMLYEADPTAGHVLGIDIGRAWIRVAAADLSGGVVARRDERNRARGAAALVKTVGEVAHDVVAAAGITWRNVAHTVVGGPGVCDPDSDRLRHAPNLPGWSRPGVMSSLREALPRAVTLDNDANLAAVGERTYGSGRDARTFVYVSVGTGIGMGVIIDGELYRGAHGAARAVDELALAAVDAEANRLALVVGTVAAIVDPEFVLLGGGIGSNIDLLRPPLERRLAELTPLAPPVAEGELGQDAIVLGAVASALDTARDLVFEQRAGYAIGESLGA